MDDTQLFSEKPSIDYSSTVDTSRPFSSVKEAVAIFGERLLAGDLYSPKPAYFSAHSTPKHENSSWKSSPSPRKPPGDHNNGQKSFVDTINKLETELEETKVELKLLKERESETEVALASLNAELHKNMSRMAEAEAVAAAKAVATSATRSASFGRGSGEYDYNGIIREEERKRDLMVRSLEQSPTLAQILSIGDQKQAGYFNGGSKERKMMKKKPIVPLVGDFFSRKKGSSNAIHNPLFSSSHVYLN